MGLGPSTSGCAGCGHEGPAQHVDVCLLSGTAGGYLQLHDSQGVLLLRQRLHSGGPVRRVQPRSGGCGVGKEGAGRSGGWDVGKEGAGRSGGWGVGKGRWAVRWCRKGQGKVRVHEHLRAHRVMDNHLGTQGDGQPPGHTG